jgi:secreted trypsin-like serine protease
MKKTAILFLSLLIGNELFAIIYRHDVPETKYRELAMQQQFNCVGEVFHTRIGMKGSGSCVLIGERYVLTAAHIFLQSDIVPDTMYFTKNGIRKKEEVLKNKITYDTGKHLIIYTNTNERMGKAEEYQCRFNRRMYAVRSIIILPQYLAKETKGQYDIALLELSDPVPNVSPATTAKTFDEKNTVCTAVGFGVSGIASDAEDVGPYHSKLAGQNMVDSIGGPMYEGRSTLLAYDFDHPTMKDMNAIGTDSALPLEFIAGGGDSGGGMFRETKNGWELIGLCARSNTNVERLVTTGYYGNDGAYTRVSAFINWIQDNIARMEKQREVRTKK